MKPVRAFSLVELLVVIAIIMLLAGLLFPVLASAKNSARQTSTMTRMRQVGMAMHMYVDDAGEWPEGLDLSFLADNGYLSDARLLLADGDPLGGDWSNYVECLRSTTKLRQSFFHPFQNRYYWESLLRVDPNAGFLACRVHSQRTARYSTESANWCSDYVYFLTGSVIRVRKDGSAKVVPFDLRPKHPNTRESWVFSRMFIDVPLEF